MIFLLDETLEKLRELKTLEDKKSTLSQEEKKKFKEYKKMIRTYILFINSQYTCISLLSKYSQDTLLHEETREKLIGNINYTVNELNNKDAVQKFKISPELRKKVDWNPQMIMNKIVELYINYS